MRKQLMLLALVLATAACAHDDSVSPRAGVPTARPHSGSSATATARNVIDVVGTPVHAVFKGAGCVATGAVAVPVVAAAGAASPPDEMDLRRRMYRTVGKTCGGSYVLTK